MSWPTGEVMVASRVVWLFKTVPSVRVNVRGAIRAARIQRLTMNFPYPEWTNKRSRINERTALSDELIEDGHARCFSERSLSCSLLVLPQLTSRNGTAPRPLAGRYVRNKHL